MPKQWNTVPENRITRRIGLNKITHRSEIKVLSESMYKVRYTQAGTDIYVPCISLHGEGKEVTDAYKVNVSFD